MRTFLLIFIPFFVYHKFIINFYIPLITPLINKNIHAVAVANVLIPAADARIGAHTTAKIAPHPMFTVNSSVVFPKTLPAENDIPFVKLISLLNVNQGVICTFLPIP